MTRIDDEIIADLYERFPELKFDDVLRNLDEDSMKSKSGKQRWRDFIMPVSPDPIPTSNLNSTFSNDHHHCRGFAYFCGNRGLRN